MAFNVFWFFFYAGKTVAVQHSAHSRGNTGPRQSTTIKSTKYSGGRQTGSRARQEWRKAVHHHHHHGTGADGKGGALTVQKHSPRRNRTCMFLWSDILEQRDLQNDLLVSLNTGYYAWVPRVYLEGRSARPREPRAAGVRVGGRALRRPSPRSLAGSHTRAVLWVMY